MLYLFFIPNNNLLKKKAVEKHFFFNLCKFFFRSGKKFVLCFE
ncbi:MAG: hypothetical protein RL757_721 [Bacteroidota bacterium]|jgi:hypothetical protein